MAGATRGDPANASDAVDGDTPARAATVLSVARSDIALLCLRASIESI